MSVSSPSRRPLRPPCLMRLSVRGRQTDAALTVDVILTELPSMKVYPIPLKMHQASEQILHESTIIISYLFFYSTLNYTIKCIWFVLLASTVINLNLQTSSLLSVLYTKIWISKFICLASEVSKFDWMQIVKTFLLLDMSARILLVNTVEKIIM